MTYYPGQEYKEPGRSRGQRVLDPTPEEISERAAEVRATWSKYKEKRRLVQQLQKLSVKRYVSSVVHGTILLDEMT